jgi:hypothetical protein
MQQIGRHALNFFRDAEVALEGKFHATGRADPGGNTAEQFSISLHYKSMKYN